MRELTLRESTPTELPLEDPEAALLGQIGASLVGSKSWWGEQAPTVGRSVVELQRRGPRRWLVTFREVVGVVRLGDLQVTVLPKIPPSHFNYLIQHSELAPRLGPQSIELERGEALPTLVARWFLTAAERLLQQGLRVDYREERDELKEVRGRLDVLATTIACRAGRSVAICEYPELDEDTALNRLVKGAAHVVAAFPGFPLDLRSRARRVRLRMDHVGGLRTTDRAARVDQLTRQYAQVLPLAKLVLDGGGIQTRLGTYIGMAFLLRTPELIEDGLRSMLAAALPELEVKKQRRYLGDSGISLNPDLIFLGGAAVADVKYRLLTKDWQTASLYQAVAFATGFNSRRSAVLGFTTGVAQPLPRPVPVGAVEVHTLRWNADPAIDPDASRQALVADIRQWAMPLMKVGAAATN